MTKGYSRLQIALHWLIFLLLIVQFVLHDPITEAWKQIQRGGEAAFDPLVAQHVFTGILILALVLLRIVVRLGRGAPALPEEEPALLKLAASATHLGLYALLLLMPISGIIAWFGNNEMAGEAHEVMRALLLLLVLVHILGALYQQFILKTDVLSRMRKPEGS